MENFTIINKCIALVAKRNSGKSVLLKDMVEHEKDEFDKIFVISPSEEINGFYKELVPPEQVFNTYSDEWIGKLIKIMTDENKGKEKHKKVLLILDDCISDVDFHHSPNFKKLFTRGRHFGVSVIITSQYLYSLPPLCRNNLCYIFCGQLNHGSLEILCGEFMGGGLSKKKFMNMYYKSTSDYHFLVISNTTAKENKPNYIYGSYKVIL